MIRTARLKKPVFIAASIAAVVGSIYLLPFGNASAQDAAGIRVSNAIVEAPLNPGESADKFITITNTSAQDLSVNTSISSLATSVGKLPPAYQTTFDASTWITASPISFKLGPNVQQQVKLHVVVPSTAESGGHYATISFATSSDKTPPPGQSQLNISGNVDAQAIVTVGGDVKTELKGIGHIGVPHFNLKSPINFDLALKNTGNVHVLPQRITINIFERGSSNPTTRLEVPPNQVQQLILPEVSKAYRVAWNQLPSVGWIRAQAIVEYAEAGGKTHVLTITSERFYVIPLAMLIVVLVIIVVAVIFLINFLLRRRRRRKRKFQSKARA